MEVNKPLVCRKVSLEDRGALTSSFAVSHWGPMTRLPLPAAALHPSSSMVPLTSAGFDESSSLLRCSQEGCLVSWFGGSGRGGGGEWTRSPNPAARVRQLVRQEPAPSLHTPGFSPSGYRQRIRDVPEVLLHAGAPPHPPSSQLLLR